MASAWGTLRYRVAAYPVKANNGMMESGLSRSPTYMDVPRSVLRRMRKR